MLSISPQDIEFLIFLEEELTEIEENGFGSIKESDLRILSSRLRNLLHEKESNLVRAFGIFNIQFSITPECIPFLYTSQSKNSAAVYAVEFGDILTLESMNNFTSSKVADDQYTLIYPLIGFERKKSIFNQENTSSLAEYLKAAVIGIDGVLINRWQIISFLANKKGIAHYSEGRDKKWQKSLDVIWSHRISKSGSSESIRSLYEAVQRIANEVLNCEGLNQIRQKTRAIINHVNSTP